jgi:hypothetical protein
VPNKSLYADAAEGAFKEGVGAGARRAGVTDVAKVRTLQTEITAKHWAAFKSEVKPTPTEARQLAADLVEHSLDHAAGRNTPHKLDKLKDAAWLGERGRQRSNGATDAKFKAADDWAKTALPRMHGLLQGGAGNRPSIVRAVLDRHTAATKDDERKGRSATYVKSARGAERTASVKVPKGGMLGGAGSAAIAAAALRASPGPLATDDDAA